MRPILFAATVLFAATAHAGSFQTVHGTSDASGTEARAAALRQAEKTCQGDFDVLGQQTIVVSGTFLATLNVRCH